VQLSEGDREFLAGHHGDGAALAMRILVRMGEVMGASRLLDIESAHIDGCLYHGEAGLDFAERLAAGGARVRVPTTLNVGSLDLLHPELFRGDPDLAQKAGRLMERYTMLGCQPTWTCAPYHLVRPRLGQHIAWAESNAIVFANSVLGARTNRYGDFIDICAAVTGRAPAAGYHLAENRLATALVTVDLPDEKVAEESTYPALGFWLGKWTGTDVAVLQGIPESVSEDNLKALGAAAASSGSVALFHVLGVTPEAPTLEAVTGGGVCGRRAVFGVEELQTSLRDLSTATGDRLDAVSIGTPHASRQELERLAGLLNGRRVQRPFFVSTGRDVVELFAGLDRLQEAGVSVVTDTCTYVTPILADGVEVVMTNSAKWAYYAPGNLGIEVVFGSLRECVESAVAGRVTRED